MALPQQPETCKQCPLYGRSKGFVHGSGPREASIALVVSGAEQTDIHQDRFLTGESGVRLDSWLYRVPLQRADIFITGLTHCWLSRKGKRGQDVTIDPPKEAVEYCWKTHTDKEFGERPNIQAIFASGQLTAEFLTGLRITERDIGSTVSFTGLAGFREGVGFGKGSRRSKATTRRDRWRGYPVLRTVGVSRISSEATVPLDGTEEL